MKPTRRSTASIDVDQLAAQILQLASSQQLVVVPATPMPGTGVGRLVLLDDGDLSAADFCQLAATAGARLLYVQADDFDAGTDPNLYIGPRHHSELDITSSTQLAELRRDAELFNGRIRQLELAFAVGGVLHCWAVAADWYGNFQDRLTELLS